METEIAAEIPAESYRNIVRLMPILCVDVVIRHKGKYLLVQRQNEPLAGYWWVIGGRVHKCETVKDAARRKVKQEVGLHITKIEPAGFYEDQYETSAWGVPTHTFSQVFEVETSGEVELDGQSSSWKLSDTLPRRFVQKWRKSCSHRA